MVYIMLKSTSANNTHVCNGLNNIGRFAEFNDESKAILNHQTLIKQSKLCGNTKLHINKLLEKNNEKI